MPKGLLLKRQTPISQAHTPKEVMPFRLSKQGVKINLCTKGQPTLNVTSYTLQKYEDQNELTHNSVLFYHKACQVHLAAN